MSSRAFTLVELMIVVMIVTVLATIAVMGVQGSLEAANRQKCISNLRLIHGAREAWFFQHDDPGDEFYSECPAPGPGGLLRFAQFGYFRGRTDLGADDVPQCPLGGEYGWEIARSDLNRLPTCSKSSQGHAMSFHE